jgi:hypothetical protein
MTDEMMTLRALVEKTPAADILRDMIGFAAQRLMEMEVGGLSGTELGKRLPDRLVQRNGHRAPDWDARRHGRAAYPETAQGQLPSELPVAPADGREKRSPG